MITRGRPKQLFTLKMAITGGPARYSEPNLYLKENLTMLRLTVVCFIIALGVTRDCLKELVVSIKMRLRAVSE
jgi:hypothetical protein